MAKKSRTPPPPRPVQAPKARGGGGRRPPTGGDRRRWLVAGAAGASGLIALAVVLAFLATRGGSSSSSNLPATMRAAGCSLQTFKSLGQRHVTSINAKIKYNSFPPTSGPHYFQPIPWGTYPNPISQVQGVHNLEHGGIVIQYGSKISEPTIGQIRDFVDADPNAMLVAPLPQLEKKIALTAWTHLALCPRFDEKAFKAFRDAYRYKGPEHFPKSLLNPGQ